MSENSIPDWTIKEDLPPDTSPWNDWRNLVNEENWSSDCCATTGLTPRLSTTRSVWALREIDNSYMGCVVWNEYPSDKIAFIGFYLLKPEYRGKGIGSILWKRAVGRMPKDYIIALRSVPVMISRYSSQTTPFKGPTLYTYTAKPSDVINMCNHLLPETFKPNFEINQLKELSNEEWQRFLEFDKKITGKNRREYLEAYCNFEHKHGVVFISKEDQQIVCYASTVLTTHLHLHRYKIAPIYALSDEIGIYALRYLAEWVQKQYDDSSLYLHQLDGIRGTEIFKSHFDKFANGSIGGVTLFSKEYSNPMDLSKVYFANNSSGHFDR